MDSSEAYVQTPICRLVQLILQREPYFQKESLKREVRIGIRYTPHFDEIKFVDNLKPIREEDLLCHSNPLHAAATFEMLKEVVSGYIVPIIRNPDLIGTYFKNETREAGIISFPSFIFKYPISIQGNTAHEQIYGYLELSDLLKEKLSMNTKEIKELLDVSNTNKI